MYVYNNIHVHLKFKQAKVSVDNSKTTDLNQPLGMKTESTFINSTNIKIVCDI